MKLTNKLRQNSSRSQGGFSIVEIIVGLVVISIILISITDIFVTTGLTQRRSAHLALASRIGEQKIESLRNEHYNSLPLSPPAIDFSDELPSDLPEPRSATVTVSEPTAGIKRLEILITYQEGPNQKVVKLTALIGNIGISQ